MQPRAQLIAVLVAIEIAIVFGMVVAVRGDHSSSAAQQRTEPATAAGPALSEGGRHRIFDVGAHPTLSVDIGYADLTVIAGDSAHVDVTASKSSAIAIFQGRAPITSRQDGSNIRIATETSSGFSMGDDRMVTVVVPPSTVVTVVNAGDIKASGLRANASFNSTGMGSIVIQDFNASSLSASSSNGRIVLHDIVAAHIDANSDDGRVEGTALSVRDGTIESNDGRVTLGFAPGSSTVVAAEANNGKIRLSGFADLPAPRRNSDDDDDSSQLVRVGGGAGHLSVHASNGNITLTQEG